MLDCTLVEFISNVSTSHEKLKSKRGWPVACQTVDRKAVWFFAGRIGSRNSWPVVHYWFFL